MGRVSDEEIKAALAIVAAVGAAIKDLGSVPSGHLYAALMGRLTYEDYMNVIGTLKANGWVREQNHLLTWIGN